MRSYWGTLAGAVVGVLGGLPGVVFGAFIGFLGDLVGLELRVHRITLRYLDGADPPAWYPRPIAVAGLLAARLCPRVSLDPETVDELATKLRPFYPDRLARRPVERILVAAAGHDWIGVDACARVLVRACAPPERERVLISVWEAVRVDGGNLPARDELRAVARGAGIDEGFILRELVQRTCRDPEACAVLGVPRDAEPGEIRAAYRRLVAQFHPDTAASLTDEQREATEQAFKRIQAAYEKLREE